MAFLLPSLRFAMDMAFTLTQVSFFKTKILIFGGSYAFLWSLRLIFPMTTLLFGSGIEPNPSFSQISR